MTKAIVQNREGHTNIQVFHIVANRQNLGKKREILFRHNGDLAWTHTNTHTHTLTHFCSVSFKSANLSWWQREVGNSRGERVSVWAAIIGHFHKDLMAKSAVTVTNRKTLRRRASTPYKNTRKRKAEVLPRHLSVLLLCREDQIRTIPKAWLGNEAC